MKLLINLIKPASWLLLLALLGTALVSEAIIIRHDVGSGDYLVSQVDYPAVFFLEQQGSRRVCVATVIHPRWAITAAHCSEETMLGETVAQGRRFGVTVANRTREIDFVATHPDYDQDSATDVDLALLRFVKESAVPRPLPIYSERDEIGQVARLLGWGFFGLGTTGRQYDDGRLRLAENRISESARRLRLNFDDPRLPGSDSLALEGTLGLGDSGGPALIESGTGLALAGVAIGELRDASYSEETQGRYGAVAIFERISEHLDWIEAIVGRALPFDS
jgi:hypothetical protein